MTEASVWHSKPGANQRAAVRILPTICHRSASSALRGALARPAAAMPERLHDERHSPDAVGYAPPGCSGLEPHSAPRLCPSAAWRQHPFHQLLGLRTPVPRSLRRWCSPTPTSRPNALAAQLTRPRLEDQLGTSRPHGRGPVPTAALAGSSGIAGKTSDRHHAVLDVVPSSLWLGPRARGARPVHREKSSEPGRVFAEWPSVRRIGWNGLWTVSAMWTSSPLPRTCPAPSVWQERLAVALPGPHVAARSAWLKN